MTAYFDDKQRYVQRDFGRQSAFSSFLPGIAGPRGIPAWCNYVNRGQAVCSFGVEDKDHAILEFHAAVDAYRQTPLTGFRTFLKCGGEILEPFADGRGTMTVETNSLMLEWSCESFWVNILYFTIPNAPLAGLCRRVCITNCTNSDISMELIDGLASIVPFGIRDEKLKQESNLSLAWMQTQFVSEHLPVFGVRATLDDRVDVGQVNGGNFCLAMTQDGTRLPFLTKPNLVFGWDTALRRPAAWESRSLSELLSVPQTANEPPCAMAAWSGTLQKGETRTLWEFYGQFEQIETLERFCRDAANGDYFSLKYAEAQKLAEQLTSKVSCKTANPVFDAYLAQNFLDNVMRGGFPYALNDDAALPPVYLYSRKHGDPEREYNDFSLGRSYFSEGNGHFRDICQNRRSDAWFHPQAGLFNVRLFFELLQPDGYVPLVIEPVSFRVRHPKVLCASLPTSIRSQAHSMLQKSFSFGMLAMQTEKWELPDPEDFLAAVLADAQPEPNAAHKEGYWSDHWTYLLDLIENYAAIYPDREAELLFGYADYRWFTGAFAVREQSTRYCMTDNGLRQYHCCDALQKTEKWVLTADGNVAKSTLAEKLLLLCAIKFATLDVSGAAVEMEGGKPGWNDALNGLPGLLGAGVPEGCELLRLLEYLLDRQALFPPRIELFTEIAALLRSGVALAAAPLSDVEKWRKRNDVRDAYRKTVSNGFCGERTAMDTEELLAALGEMANELRCAIAAETEKNGGICPTYFYYRASDLHDTPQGLLPQRMEKVTLPLFLEGPTRYLQTKLPLEVKHRMAQAVKESALYDQKLNMYRLNENLSETSCEIGRIWAFPRGWLENESIWLHMEYKYFLSLLCAGLYEAFFEDFETAAIPFLPPEQYKRSTLEGSSFLVSSANPDSESHGRGYVARLSGSTAEMISIWNHMFFGATPFFADEAGLQLQFRPALPKKLVGSEDTVWATFLGHVRVVYHLNGLRELHPRQYRVERYVLDGTTTILASILPAPWAERVRAGEIQKIDVSFTGERS